MRILHTSDWHLGKRLDDFSRMDEQRAVLEEICEIADKEQVDVVLVSGDLFDTFNPSTEAVELFYKSLKRLTNNGRRPVIAIAGNHDSPDRIEAPDPLARECGIIFAGYPNSYVSPYSIESGFSVLRSAEGFIELMIPGNKEPLRILMTPYANEYRLKSFLGLEDSEAELRSVLQESWKNLADMYCDDKGVNVLVSHLFVINKGGPVPEEPEDEKPILHVGGAQAVYTENIPIQVQYTALGHLHRMHRVDNKGDNPVYYSGSPLSYSFSEANQKKYVLIIDVSPSKEANVNEIELTRNRRLLRKRVYGVDEAIRWLLENTDALVELTVVTDTFLTAMDRKQLSAVHSGIVSIIPEVSSKDIVGCETAKVDLDQSMDELFKDYFLYSKGQLPNEDIMNLFNELKAEE